MSSFFKCAKVVHDVESDLTYVEIVYDSYIHVERDTRHLRIT